MTQTCITTCSTASANGTCLTVRQRCCYIACAITTCSNSVAVKFRINRHYTRRCWLVFAISTGSTSVTAESAVCMFAGASPIDEVSLKQYSKSLQRVAVLRLLQQLSHVYSVMKIPALADLVPFMGFGEVEQIIVDAVKHDFLQASLPFQSPPPSTPQTNSVWLMSCNEYMYAGGLCSSSYTQQL